MQTITWGYGLSCFNQTALQAERSPEEKFACIKAAQVDGYQFDVPGELAIDDLERLGEEYGLASLALNDYQQDLSRFDEYLAICQRLGTTVYNHHFPTACLEDLPKAAALARDLQQKCSDAGVLYCIELHRGSLTHDIANAYALRDLFPEVNYLADFSHYIIQGVSYDRCRDLLPNVKAMHLRVANSECSQPPIHPGKTIGLDGFEAIFKDLLAGGFSGPVISEMIPYYLQYPPYDLHEHNCRIIELAKGWLGA